jgi:mRNA interferase MazF
VVEVSQGEIWWAELPEPSGHGPGFRRPLLIVQGNHLNRSKIGTVVCVPLTSNLTWAGAPGNVTVSAEVTRLSKNSVANPSQIVAIDRTLLVDRVSKLPPKKLAQVMIGIDVVLGR